MIADNLAAHKSLRVQKLPRSQGSGMLFLPTYRPDLNPIEVVYSKPTAHLRRMAARTSDALTCAVCSICNLFLWQACQAYFKAIGYVAE